MDRYKAAVSGAAVSLYAGLHSRRFRRRRLLVSWVSSNAAPVAAPGGKSPADTVHTK
ncbi:MAG: hypothetical protein OJF58_000467 [Enhydrobacter sp.]|nr:MAG: hypothetical protein OJF58_000467 [Enhydrobacter sp.]